jgi:hypothetical protein
VAAGPRLCAASGHRAAENTGGGERRECADPHRSRPRAVASSPGAPELDAAQTCRRHSRTARARAVPHRCRACHACAPAVRGWMHACMEHAHADAPTLGYGYEDWDDSHRFVMSKFHGVMKQIRALEASRPRFRDSFRVISEFEPIPRPLVEVCSTCMLQGCAREACTTRAQVATPPSSATPPPDAHARARTARTLQRVRGILLQRHPGRQGSPQDRSVV